jgi:hypothetical protein
LLAAGSDFFSGVLLLLLPFDSPELEPDSDPGLELELDFESDEPPPSSLFDFEPPLPMLLR